MQRDIREGMMSTQKPILLPGWKLQSRQGAGRRKKWGSSPSQVCSGGTQSMTQRVQLTANPVGDCAKGNGPWGQRGRELSRGGKNCHACPSVCFKTSHELVFPEMMWDYRNMWCTGPVANRAVCATQLFLPPGPACRNMYNHGGTRVWPFTT